MLVVIRVELDWDGHARAEGTFDIFITRERE